MTQNMRDARGFFMQGDCAPERFADRCETSSPEQADGSHIREAASTRNRCSAVRTSASSLKPAFSTVSCASAHLSCARLPWRGLSLFPLFLFMSSMCFTVAKKRQVFAAICNVLPNQKNEFPCSLSTTLNNTFFFFTTERRPRVNTKLIAV